MDLLPVLEGRNVDALVVNRLDGHPNEEAHALFAEEILRGFQKRGERLNPRRSTRGATAALRGA